MTYQRVSGTVNQGAHPGSYNGQDAYNDLLVVEDERIHISSILSVQDDRGSINCEEPGLQRCDRYNNRGGEESMSEPAMMSDRKGHNGISDDGTATTLTAEEKDRPIVGTAIVRRLTPLETERLQGMPDDWSRYGISEKGKVYELTDSARYRLQGNGICTPFWRWLMKRISAQYERTPTLGSLFDGQSSFPMIWEGINGPGTAVWSSEIKKHAIAVAKYHFPEGE